MFVWTNTLNTVTSIPGACSQACTEMVMPFCYDGVKDFFEPAPWDIKEYSEICRKTWGVTPLPYMAPLMYGGWDYWNYTHAPSNIVFR